ncbi:M1 family metallopeptidase [Pedobacter heparinus]|uniref:M1 family metallopeptidase n=1 Tax=Pedobacter heparinus TaxID=984 RepID=UPI00292DDD99|nr:M1 family metallopeptidase [Pedobacter heparinus]
MMKRTAAAALFLMLSVSAFAQTLPVPTSIQEAYAKGTRSKSGKPGPAYWQNIASYQLKANFNPLSRELKGQAEIVYVNNSPDTLKQLWFKLYPNLYQKGGNVKTKIALKDLGPGVELSSVQVNGKAIAQDELQIAGTNMHTNIAALAPGQSLKLKMDYQYVLNKGSHMRTGQVNDSAHFVAYFFPRIAVYDDIDGWNKYPYTGEEEFYNDFCNFKAEITVPKDYVVWATGDLLNPKAVFRKEIAGRLGRAEETDEVLDVITATDLQQKQVTSTKAFNTYIFEAKNVTDFVFATSNHYLWKSSSLIVDSLTKRRIRVDAAFNPIHKDYHEVIDFTRKTVYLMSHVFPKWPFPYAHETVFDGLDQMEYPMMVNDNPVEKRADAITLTVHEVFHTLFPFYMGTNETKYGWMDEGWATLGEWLLAPMIDTSLVDDYGVESTAISSGTKNDVPIVTLTPDLKGVGTFTNSYPKPGMGYLFVKDYLGDELFIKALHHYMKTWQGKHPMPFDFFYCMNEASGKNLDWFWKRWFFEDGITDMAIKAVVKTAAGYQVTIANKSSKPLPIDLNLEYADGSSAQLHRSIGVWEKGDPAIDIDLPTLKTLKRVVLGSVHVPDKDKSDNTFKVK